MFEKEAEEYGLQQSLWCTSESGDLKEAFKDGAEFGYNKANEWHYPSKGELPETSGKYLVLTGGEPFILDYDTEAKDFGYWCLDVGDNFGIRDTIFETITKLDEDKVIAWKEIILPKEPSECLKMSK